MGEWVRLRENSPVLGTDEMGSPLLLNGNGRAALGEELLRATTEARRSVSVVNPLLTDHRMLEALIVARKRRIKVKVITELRENRGGGIRFPTRGFEAESPANLQEHFRAVRLLAGNLVSCRGLRHYAHAKILLVDEERLILSSANWVPNSLGWGPRPALEAGVYIDRLDLAATWAGAFGQLWEACPFRLRQQDRDLSLQQERVRELAPGDLECAGVGGVRMSWTFPPSHRGLRDLLVGLVQQAQKRLILAAMSFFDVEAVSGLQEALVGALCRGVRVTVIVRPEEFRSDQYPDPSTRRLVQQGLRLLGIEGLHAKGVLVDRFACALFSANFNPYSLDSNADSAHVECGLCETGGLSLLLPYANFLEHLEQQATHFYGPG